MSAHEDGPDGLADRDDERDDGTGGDAASDAGSDPSADGPRPVFRAHMVALCERAFGAEVVSFAFPGGSRRDSCRLVLSDGRSLIATIRDETHRAELEANVLDALAPHGAPAPRVLADNGRVLFQEDRGSERLSVALHRADASRAGELLGGALASLVALQEAGRRAGLVANVPMLGCHHGWIESLIDRPVALGSLLDVEPPRPDVEAMRDLLGVLDPAFIKWDARPANAVLGPQGAISWIDFEHCGARNPLDDLAWLLADETVPHDAQRDEALVDYFVPQFGSSLPTEMRAHYAWVMCVLHGTHRLNLVVGSALEDSRGWRDPDRCIERDSVGVARGFALRQCARLAHHAGRSSLTAPLAPFFEACAEAMPR